MKKILALVLSVLLIFCFSGCSLEEVSMLYTEDGEKDGFTVFINETANCCFVSGYICAEYTENLEITIPDDYNGIPIKRIGGHHGSGAPTPFSIPLNDLYMNAPEGSYYDTIYCGDISEFNIPRKHTVKDIVFDLNIGKNIEVVDFVVMDEYYPHINEDGSITLYHSVVNINCSNENQHFYSKDGKLYNKKTDELITDFAYVSDK